MRSGSKYSKATKLHPHSEVGRLQTSRSLSVQKETGIDMEGEPQPVTSWKSAIGFVAWLLLLAGAFLVVLGCSSLTGGSCSPRLVIRSLAATGAGAFLLLTKWVVWGDEDGSRGRSSPKSRLKQLLRKAVTYAILGILLAVFLAIGFV